MFTLYSVDALRAYCRSIYGDKKLLLTPQIYASSPGDVADAADVGGNIQITQNADFILLGFALTALSPLLPMGTILFSDSGSGEQFMSRPANFRNCLTLQNGTLQTNLHWPRFIGGNSSVTYALTNNSGATLDDPTVSIIGFNVREYA
jgi:hypothetical protein